MRFHTPDSWSPFAAGGLNTYCYCLGDPVNHLDPTGHLTVAAWRARTTNALRPIRMRERRVMEGYLYQYEQSVLEFSRRDVTFHQRTHTDRRGNLHLTIPANAPPAITAASTTLDPVVGSGAAAAEPPSSQAAHPPTSVKNSQAPRAGSSLSRQSSTDSYDSTPPNSPDIARRRLPASSSPSSSLQEIRGGYFDPTAPR